MTVKVDLFNVLKLICPRTFPGFAPTSTARPYITYQRIGGDVINPLANDVPDKKLGDFQINVWADTQLAADSMIELVEIALRQATVFQARPINEPSDDWDADMNRYCAIQDFRIISGR